MITLQKVMATSDAKFVRLCQVGAKAPVEAALAGGQAVKLLVNSRIKTVVCLSSRMQIWVKRSKTSYLPL